MNEHNISKHLTKMLSKCLKIMRSFRYTFWQISAMLFKEYQKRSSTYACKDLSYAPFVASIENPVDHVGFSV